MQSRIKIAFLASTAAILGACAPMSSTSQSSMSPMSFFVTSVNPGNGGDLGGLAGADAHCQRLATSANAGGKNWRAYLSSATPAVNARDRIGKGPWQNVNGVVVAASVEELHSELSNVTKETALTEKGGSVMGRGDEVNMHDILTGSDPQGLYATAGGDTTCKNWTSNSEGSAIVGHHDRKGLKETRHMMSWNSSHGTRGCGQEDLKGTGGAGLFYCFAAE